MNDLEREMERQLRASVWKQAENIPLDVPPLALARELIDTMPQMLSDAEKVHLMAVAYVAALKMLVELVPDPLDRIPGDSKQD